MRNGTAKSGLKFGITVAMLMSVAPQGWAQVAADPGGAESSAEGGLAEVVVTAQRRSENLQRAAIAVSAVDPDTIRAQVTAAENLGELVPSVVIGAGGAGANLVAIRGVGTLASNGLSENVVAFNLDGVYLARPAASNGIFFDLERIEVLKGPQGTLYGRNATAGAVNMISRRPGRELGGYVVFQAGNYGLYQAQGAVNLPVSDSYALRFAAQGIQRDGYLSDGYNDQEQYSGRVSLLADPNPDLTMLFTADVTHIGGRGQTNVLSPLVVPSDPYLGPTEAQSRAVYQGFPFFPLPVTRDDGFNDLDLWGLSGNMEWRTSAGTITVLPAYRRSNIDYRHYAAGFEVNTSGEKSDQMSLEMRFATLEERRLRAVLGGYYFEEDGEFVLAFQTVPSFVQPVSVVDIRGYETRSLAAFSQATFDLTSTLRLVGGLRYSNEKKSVQGFANGGAPVLGDLSDDNVNWRVGLESDVSPRSLLFATVATGFKAGGFYASLPPNTFEPEELTAYTVGSKNRFLDNRLQLNAEAFYWKYDDKQVSHLGPVRPAGFNLITENAGEATLYGLELESSFLFTPDDLFSANVLYNHTEYDSFVYSQTTVTGPPTTSCAIRPDTATSVIVDCSGNELQQAPRWSVNLRYEHSFHLANADRLVFAAAGSHRSEYWLGDEQLVGQLQDSYVTGDLDLTYHAPADRWYLAAFVQNVGDKAVKSQSFVQPLLGRPMVGLYPPRTYGVRAGVNF